MAPGEISDDAIATQAIPRPNNIIPKAYLMLALGLYLLSHHLENKGANIIINKEFNTPNQDAGTSVTSSLNCSFNIQIAIIHIITKLNVKKIFDLANFEKVCLNNNHRTQVMIPKGIIVIKELIILKIKAELPSKTR